VNPIGCAFSTSEDFIPLLICDWRVIVLGGSCEGLLGAAVSAAAWARISSALALKSNQKLSQKEKKRRKNTTSLILLLSYSSELYGANQR